MARILVVEDHPMNMEVTTLYVEKAGHVVLPAVNALQGLELARSAAPDLILMDVQLPGMSGLEAAALLKADPATQRIPLLALTALAMRGDEDACLAAGCDGYLSKPLRYQELWAALSQHLGAAGTASTTSMDNKQVQP